jgi:hypothetical protein
VRFVEFTVSVTKFASDFAIKYGTPLPMVLNILDNDMSGGKTYSIGNDCIARASAADILLGL